MIQLGQIERNQYSLKKEKFRQNYSGAYHSQNHIINLNNKKALSQPLQRGMSGQTQVSFKGFNFRMAQNAFKPIIKPIPQTLTEKVFNSLKNISEVEYEYYKKVVNDYVNFIKIPKTETQDAVELALRQAGSRFRKRNGITDKMAEKISENSLFYLPQKTVPTNFAKQVIAPLKVVFDALKKTIFPLSKEKKLQNEIENKILKDFASFQGLVKSHEIWENGYRKISGHSKWIEGKDFIIPDEVLFSKIQRRRNKVVDPNKGKYSSTSMMLGNRFISGIIYSYFLGTDAYNTTMRYSNDEKEAATQRNSRIMQEFSRIGMNMYVQNLLFGTFEAAVNKSLATAMFVSGSTVAFSEVLGRKLVGKPIMPSDKESLDRLEKEMNEKKGVLPAIGRLLTNVKKKAPISPENTQLSQVSYAKTPANTKLFSSFTNNDKNAVTNNENAAIPSFKGFYKVENLVDKKNLENLIKIIEKADPQRAKTIKEIILKSLKKSEYLREQNISKPQNFEDLQKTALEKLPLGQKKTPWGLWTNSFLVPFKFVSNLITGLTKKTKQTFDFVFGRKNNNLANELSQMKANDKRRADKFKQHFEQRMKLPAWANSKLSEEEKELRIFKEFKEIKGKDKEDIEGVKNILLWIEKQLKNENIKIDKTVEPDEAAVEKVRKMIMDSVLKADSAKHVEYDGNTLAQTNINLSRAITTLFLMTDSYNLTMQYSNDNKKDANKSAKNRAAQEISRIGVSAYILAFVHNLLSKLCNSSLGGAFTLTALTSSINDSISRKVVGVPLTAKTQEQLYEIDKQNAKSKSPIKKALAYSIGKKSALPQTNSQQKAQIRQNQPTSMDYFDNDYFIMPKISN